MVSIYSLIIYHYCCVHVANPACAVSKIDEFHLDKNISRNKQDMKASMRQTQFLLPYSFNHYEELAVFFLKPEKEKHS